MQNKISALLAEGLARHRTGDIAAASVCYRQILQIDGRQCEALHLLGTALLQEGNARESCCWFEQALAIDAERTHTWSNLGLAYQQSGRTADAVNAYWRVVQRQPDAKHAWLGLGRACRAHGAYEEAVAAVRNLLALEPADSDGLALLAELGESSGQWGIAVDAYRQLLPISQEPGKVKCNLGNALLANGNHSEAVAVLEEAVAHSPEMFEAWHNLGRAAAAGNPGRARDAFARALDIGGHRETAEAWLRLELDAGDWIAAQSLARQLANSNPLDGEAWSRLAGIEIELGHAEAARIAADQSVSIAPTGAAGWLNRGLARHRLNDFVGAAADYARAMELDGGLAAVAASNRVRALTDAQLWDEARGALEVALALPNWAEELASNATSLLLACCDWEGMKRLERKCLELGSPLAARLSPFTALAYCDDPALQQRLARAHGANLAPASAVPSAPASRERSGRIRIGYLSADFHAHATGFLAADLFECHDRDRFAVFAYSIGPDDGSPMRRRLEAAFETFRDLRERGAQELAAAIRADQIDILVDLKGYTFRGMPRALAMRPAAVQVSFLGYPGTMGVPWMDYIIADGIALPPDQDIHYDERVIRLPHCYQPNDRQRPWQRQGSRRDWGLPDIGMVYCCFNQAYKITEAVFSVWLEILAAVPGSVLWLLDQNPVAKRHLRSHAQAKGLDLERLVFAPAVPQTIHLGRLAHADVCLDTLPYNAHTTASDALWVGVPVVTVAGQGFAARVASSLLTAAGLPDLICADHEAYRQLAVELGQDPTRLHALKERLGTGNVGLPLFDTPAYTRGLEAAYEAMMRR